jgi:hypothetical protein
MKFITESPFNNTSLRLLYLHHEFSNNSQLRGGHLDVFAAQIRLALTERLALIRQTPTRSTPSP